jgi:Uma2 family endonuclease
MIARLVEAFAEEAGVELSGFGNETYRKRKKTAGLEPDECYCIDEEKPFPDLAIEVVQSSGGIDKLEIYRRLGVREVWFFVDGEFEVFRLRGEAYRRARASVALRGIDLREIARIVLTIDRGKQTRAVRTYRRSLRRRLNG